MVKVRTRGERVRSYILENIEKYPADIAKHASEKFQISRQAVSKHLKYLVDEKVLLEEGQTRNRIYKLCPLAEFTRIYPLARHLEEDVVWRNDIRQFLGQLPENVLDIWQYGFTEMLNNAIDHSGAAAVSVDSKKTATGTELWITDNGIGIFKKIQEVLGLLDTRHAVLELAKGKLTTDPSRHTGEGIFFTSRMFDQFIITSSDTYFSHRFVQDEDWILEHQSTAPRSGTSVFMKLNNHTARTTKKIFDEYISEDIGFIKTVVPVRLAQYGDDKLVSRSQAKRLLDRVDRFKTVHIDFSEVTSIGQAFADEIFRVFSNDHPGVELRAIHANQEIQGMINRVQAANSGSGRT